MKIGIVTRREGWCSSQLKEAMLRKGVTPLSFSFNQLVARVNYEPKVSINNLSLLKDVKALIIRPVGRGSLEEIIFRMDILYRLENLGMLIINPPLSIERCVDKYRALALLEDHGLPVPRTAVTEDSEKALEAFYELGGDVIVKPLFGSRGLGSTRVSDPEIASRIFRSLSFYHNVIYLQEFVPHGFSDIRAFVVGDEVVAAMRRLAETWKTNISQGAKPIPIKLDSEMEELAIKAAHIVGCKVAGVDILESRDGPLIVELNSQPGWRGLQSVSEVCIADKIIDYVLSELKTY